MSRAKRKAAKTKDQAVVLKCDLNVQQFHKRVSGHQIASKGGTIAIRAHVPPAVIISHFSATESVKDAIPLADPPPNTSLNGCLDDLPNGSTMCLDLNPTKVSKSAIQGIERLAQWVIKHYDANPASVPPRGTLTGSEPVAAGIF